MKKLNFFNRRLSAGRTVPWLLAVALSSWAVASPQSETKLNTFTHQQIGQMAVDYVKELFPPPPIGQMHYEAVQLDKRIKIKPCSQPLALTIPGNASLKRQTTVQVRCDDSKSWNLYARVRVSQKIPVVVARNNLAPGTVIGEQHLITQLKDANQIRGRSLQDTGTLLGAKASRYITAGQPVTLRQVCLVCSGDTVSVTAKIKGLRVKTTGISQQNGSLGDNIAILNQRSGKRIEARVVAVNRVEINI